MKFLFVLYIGFDKHGPSVHLLTDIIEQCLISGHSVEMIVRNRGGQAPDIPLKLQKYDNLKCHVIKDVKLEKSALIKRYFEDIRYAFKCKRIYKNIGDIDAVFLQSHTSPLFSITLIKKTLNKPILFNVQNIFPIDALVLGKLRKHGIKGIIFKIFQKMQQRAYRKADRIVTICEDMKNTLINENVSSDKLDVVYNWSYSDEPYIIKDEDNLFLKTHNVDKNKFRVVFSGNLGAMVNAKLIADAAEIVSDEKNIHFYIIGDGNNMPVLKSLINEKGLINVSFYPYQPVEFAPHNYAMAHININALPEGIVYTCMPSKTATCLNCARPMVVSMEKESSLAKLLEQVDKCTVVDVNDSMGFAEAILFNYKNNITQDSVNSREIFKKLCSKSNAKKYVDILENCVSDRNR